MDDDDKPVTRRELRAAMELMQQYVHGAVSYATMNVVTFGNSPNADEEEEKLRALADRLANVLGRGETRGGG